MTIRDGTFQAAVNYAAGSNPQSVAVGDFNRDGRPDLAVANLSGNVSVLLGNGDGTFQAAVNYAAGSGPSSVAVGDFNGDGRPDLAVANQGSNNVSVLLGNGDGTFQVAANFAAGGEPGSVAVGDFNGDGRPDLAVANLSGNVSVLLGNGDGTFQAAVNYAAGSNPPSVAVGDFNGDRKPDLAVADSGGGVSILINTSLNPILSVTIMPDPSAGRVTSNPAGIDCPAGACSSEFDPRSTVTITASADVGATFDHWEGDCSGTDPTTTVVMDRPNKSCNAVFDAASTLSVTINPAPSQGGVTSDPPGIDCPAISCSITLQRGASVTLKAAPQPGF